MKTLILNGSPRKNGDGMAIISRMCEFLQGEVKIISPNELNISVCQDCRLCQKDQRCVVKDDMEEVYEYLEEADNLIISSPIHLSSLSAPLLTLLGRLPCLHRHYKNVQTTMKKKNGVYILTAGGEVFPWRSAEEADEEETEYKADQVADGQDKRSNLSDAARLAGKSVKRWMQREEDKRAAAKDGAVAVAAWVGGLAKNFGEAGENTTRYLEPLLYTIFKRLNTRRVGWIKNFSTSFAPAADSPQTMNEAKSTAQLLNRLYHEKIQKESDKEQLDREKEMRRMLLKGEEMQRTRRGETEKKVRIGGVEQEQEQMAASKERPNVKKGTSGQAERERIRIEKQAEKERARYR